MKSEYVFDKKLAYIGETKFPFLTKNKIYSVSSFTFPYKDGKYTIRLIDDLNIISVYELKDCEIKPLDKFRNEKIDKILK